MNPRGEIKQCCQSFPFLVLSQCPSNSLFFSTFHFPSPFPYVSDSRTWESGLADVPVWIVGRCHYFHDRALPGTGGLGPIPPAVPAGLHEIRLDWICRVVWPRCVDVGCACTGGTRERTSCALKIIIIRIIIMCLHEGREVGMSFIRKQRQDVPSLWERDMMYLLWGGRQDVPSSGEREQDVRSTEARTGCTFIKGRGEDVPLAGEMAGCIFIRANDRMHLHHGRGQNVPPSKNWTGCTFIRGGQCEEGGENDLAASQPHNYLPAFRFNVTNLQAHNCPKEGDSPSSHQCPKQASFRPRSRFPNPSWPLSVDRTSPHPSTFQQEARLCGAPGATRSTRRGIS